MTLYILNSPVMPCYGHYRFEPITLQRARLMLLKQPFISAVGHPSTAELLSELLGVWIPANRIQITELKKGDQILVFRLLQRLPEGKVLTREELAQVPFELGLITFRPSRRMKANVS